MACPFLPYRENSAAPMWPEAHTCCFSTSSPQPQRHVRPPARGLFIPISLDSLTYLISLLRNHRWLPSTLGTKPNSLAWHSWIPSMLFDHVSQDFALGILPSNLVDFLPRNSGGLQAVPDHPLSPTPGKICSNPTCARPRLHATSSRGPQGFPRRKGALPLSPALSATESHSRRAVPLP